MIWSNRCIGTALALSWLVGLGAQDEVAYDWRQVQIGGGGWVTGIYPHPLVRDLIQVRTDVGGSFRWDAAAERWLPSRDGSVDGLALDPTDPDIVYRAEGHYTADWSAEPGSIWKSTDRGATWRQVTPVGWPVKCGGNEPHRWSGERLVVDPTKPAHVWFGSRNHGLWVSRDAGTRWQRVELPTLAGASTGTAGIGIQSITFDPMHPGTVALGVHGAGVVLSHDRGERWQWISGAPDKPSRLCHGRDGTLWVSHAVGIARWRNGRWDAVAPVAGGFSAIAVDPRDPRHVLAGTGSAEHWAEHLWRTRDGGTTWARCRLTLESDTPIYASGPLDTITVISHLAFDVQVPGRLWLAESAGILRSDDLTADPIRCTTAVHGLEETVALALAKPPGQPLLSGLADFSGFRHGGGVDRFPERSLAAVSDGPKTQDSRSFAISHGGHGQELFRISDRREWGTESYLAHSADGGATWTNRHTWDRGTWPSTTGIAMRVAVSPRDPANLMVLITGKPYQVSTDGGRTFTDATGLPKGPSGGFGPWWHGQFLAADGQQDGTFYVYDGFTGGDGRVYRSTDRGARWQAMGQLPTADAGRIVAMPERAGHLWAALGEQGLQRSRDGGSAWERLPGFTAALAIGFGAPLDASTMPAIYVTGTMPGTGDGTGDGVWRSGDAGATWQRIGRRGADQPLGLAGGLIIGCPDQPGLVFVAGGGRGIYVGEPITVK